MVSLIPDSIDALQRRWPANNPAVDRRQIQAELAPLLAQRQGLLRVAGRPAGGAVTVETLGDDPRRRLEYNERLKAELAELAADADRRAVWGIILVLLMLVTASILFFLALLD